MPNNTSKKFKFSNLNIFWLGFSIYSLTVVFGATQAVNIKILQGIQIVGLILMFKSIISLVRFKFDNEYLRIIYTIYCGWLFIMILKGYHLLTDYTYLKSFLFNPSVGMLYFSPLILLFPRNFIFFKKLFNVIAIFGIFYVIYDMIFIKYLINRDHSSLISQQIVETFSDLSFPSGFLLLTFAYHTKKRQLIALGVVALALLFAVIRARRGLIFIYSNMIFFAYIIFILFSKKKLWIIYLTVFIAFLGAVYVTTVYKPSRNPIFGFLVERRDEDTRSIVELYFHDDMKPKDWITGRGINGQYFCPNVEENQITNFRSTIETGYEQTILKGGLISLGLFLLIAIPAVIAGIFYSKNILSKAAGIWIFISLVDSYPGTVNAFTLNYLVVWVSIGICYSKEIRRMTDTDIADGLHEV
jgi:hypothetical protein